MSPHCNISIFHRTINIINLGQKDACFINKEEGVKKKMCICSNKKTAQTKKTKNIFQTMFEFVLA